MDLSLTVPLVLLIIGSVVAAAVAGRGESSTATRVLTGLAWGPGIVTGILSLATFFGTALGSGPPGRGALIASLIAAAAAMWAAPRFGAAKPASHPLASDRRLVPPSWWLGGAVVFATVYGWMFLRWLAARPLGSFDAMGIWTYRALQWFRAGEAFPETVGLMVESKPGYPLFLPGLVTSQFSLWGGETVVIPVAAGGLFVIGLGAMLVLAVLRDAPPAAALAAAALALSTPVIWWAAFFQGADLPLAYLALSAAFGLTELMRHGRSSAVPPWLVGFFLGLMIWTKNEGLVLAGALVVGAGIASLPARGRTAPNGTGDGRRIIAGLAIGALPGALATAIFKIAWAPAGEAQRFLSDGFFQRLVDPGRWAEVGWAFASRLIPGAADAIWGGSAVLLVCVAAVVVGKLGCAAVDRAGWVFLGAAVSVTVFFFAVYLITPDPLEWHLRNSLDRVLLQVFPLVVVGLAVSVMSAVRDDSG
ncbi:MAG: hypothetical protein V2I67_19105 [Thermoanaerobaculales bacterium]|nr:hypothetical protein [Thermoanaerobaculales bacterium]